MTLLVSFGYLKPWQWAMYVLCGDSSPMVFVGTSVAELLDISKKVWRLMLYREGEGGSNGQGTHK